MTTSQLQAAKIITAMIVTVLLVGLMAGAAAVVGPMLRGEETPVECVCP